MDSLPTPASSNRGVPVARKLFTEAGAYGSPVSNDSQALWSHGSGSGKFVHNCKDAQCVSDSASSDVEEETDRESGVSSEEGEKILPEPTHIKPGETHKLLRGAVVTLPVACASGAGMEGVTRTQDDDLHPSGSLRPAPALASVFPPQKPSKQSSNILSNPLYDRPQPQPQAMSAKSLFKSKLPTTAPTAPAPLQIKRADLRQIVSPELQMEERRELLDRDGELCHPIASQGWKVYPGIVAGRAANEVSCGISVRQPLYSAQESPEPTMPVYLNQESPQPSSPEPRVSSRYLTQETPEPLSLGTLSPRQGEPRVSSRYLTQETPEPLSLEPLSPRNDVMNSSSPVHEGEPGGSSTDAGTSNKKSERSESPTGKENKESESFAFDNRFNRISRPGLMTGAGDLFHVGRATRPDPLAEASCHHSGDSEKHRRPLRINTGAISHALNQNWPKTLRNPSSQWQTDGKGLSRIPKASNLPHPDGASIDADCAISGQQPLQATLGAAGVVVSRIPRRPVNSGPVLSRKLRPMESKIPQCADGREAAKAENPGLGKNESLETPGSPRSEDSPESVSNSLDSDDTCTTPDSVFGLNLDQSHVDSRSERDDAAVDVNSKVQGRYKRQAKWGSSLEDEYSVELKINVPKLLENLLFLSLLLLGGIFAVTALRIAGGTVPQPLDTSGTFLSDAMAERILSLPDLPGSTLCCVSSWTRAAVSNMSDSIRSAIKRTLRRPGVAESTPANAESIRDSASPHLTPHSDFKPGMSIGVAEHTRKGFTMMLSSFGLHTQRFAGWVMGHALPWSPAEWLSPSSTQANIETEAPAQAETPPLSNDRSTTKAKDCRHAECQTPLESGSATDRNDGSTARGKDCRQAESATKPKDCRQAESTTKPETSDELEVNKEPLPKVMTESPPVIPPPVKKAPPSGSNDNSSSKADPSPKVTPPPVEKMDSKAGEPMLSLADRDVPPETAVAGTSAPEEPKVSTSDVSMGSWSSKGMEEPIQMQFRYEPTLVEIINWNIERLCFVMFTMGSLYFVFTGERVDFGGAELSCGYQPRRLF